MCEKNKKLNDEQLDDAVGGMMNKIPDANVLLKDAPKTSEDLGKTPPAPLGISIYL